ncbi:phage shock protein PspA [Paraglaciecola psychrophila]|uniref:Phage shock protein A, PspA n=1 Tax=Paraglaciecola psychrophila 170 TaxID=1129794 RepID=K7AMD4_9ALTE|nr:phage shock protein PspA [Paraglaciecola psychrophila]AGH47316.1 phage shock protein A, PspA [Paraglaciecola psychrophila 170]GAC36550.1 phage shock protein A [Paraglaciecola psychrophila 170]
MGMFTRMSDIVQANINAILDKAEEPAKVIKLLIQEMEETLVELRSVAATNLAEKKHVERQVDKLHQQINAWQTKATLAVEKDREDLARAALGEKHHSQQKLSTLADEQNLVAESLCKLQADMGKLQDKLVEARAKQKSLIIRERSVAVRMTVKNKAHSVKIDDAIIRFEQYERRIDDLESQVDAYDLVNDSQGLHVQFNQLEAESQIEQELEALRKKVA